MSYATFSTATLPSPARCLVLEPPSYRTAPGRRYPLLVFLHDGYGNVRTLDRRGVAADLFARMADGRLPEFLVVAPGAPGSWFSDSADGRRRWEEFLTGDLIRQIELRYRVLPGAASRGLTGISMGGFGAVKIALKHPGLYGSVSTLSGALIPISLEDLRRYGWVTRLTLKRVFGRHPDPKTLSARRLGSSPRRALRPSSVRRAPARGNGRLLRARRRCGSVRDVHERARDPDGGRARAGRTRLELLAPRARRDRRVARETVFV
jgi:pimeloyl-ACP methyl ester carboxylesterase